MTDFREYPAFRGSFRLSDEWLEDLQERAILWDLEALEPVDFDHVEVVREGDASFSITFYGLADERYILNLEVVDRKDYEVLIEADDRWETVLRPGDSFRRTFKFEPDV
jgi:hypothetical protein